MKRLMNCSRYIKPILPKGKVRKLAVDATMRTAAPYQVKRRAREFQKTGQDTSGRVFIESSDVRAKKMARKASVAPALPHSPPDLPFRARFTSPPLPPDSSEKFICEGGIPRDLRCGRLRLDGTQPNERCQGRGGRRRGHSAMRVVHCTRTRAS